jgi:hypothetical protein
LTQKHTAFVHCFKTDFKFEEYFNILDEQNSLLLCKFRTTNHKLPIEKGRWSNKRCWCPTRLKQNINLRIYNINSYTGPALSQLDQLLSIGSDLNDPLAGVI